MSKFQRRNSSTISRQVTRRSTLHSSGRLLRRSFSVTCCAITTATSITNNVATITLNIAVPLDIGVSVKLINLAHATFLNGVPLTVTSVSNNGLSFTATFTHADNSTVEPTGTATFGFPANINFLQFGQLNATWKALYQQAYTNFCCCPQC